MGSSGDDLVRWIGEAVDEAGEGVGEAGKGVD